MPRLLVVCLPFFKGGDTQLMVAPHQATACRLWWRQPVADLFLFSPPCRSSFPPAPPFLLSSRPCSNLVYMGMGEPMHNLEAVLPSIDILCQPLGMHFSYNKVRGGAVV